MASPNRAGSRDLQRHVQDVKTPADAPSSNVGNNRQSSGGVPGAGNKQQYRLIKGTNIKRPHNPDAEAVLDILWHPMNLFLIFMPLGIAAHYLKWGGLLSFWLNFAAMIPMAKIMGDATEELAASLRNDMIAGLLNATFGNAVEVVITINTLRAGLLRIVKASLLGSVLSNTLLVLGMSFLCGGLFTFKKTDAEYDPLRADSASRGDGDEIQRHDSALNFDEKIQSFSLLGALVNTSMLLVSCTTFSLITIFRCVLLEDDDEANAIVLPVSRVSSIIIMLAYVAYVLFQLVTHKAAMSDQGDDDEDVPVVSMWVCILILFVTTATVAFVSDLLVDAIHGVTASAHLSEHFIGIILLPIVGNACEHAAAVRFAVQDKLGLSVSIAVGSSTQIALFVVPFSVIAGWFMNVDMDLNFGILNSSLITLSVVVVLSMVVDGQSNWLQGYLLCSVYAIISVMYWNLPNEIDDGTFDAQSQ